MTDFINKIITIVLIFIMLILAPLLISYMSTDMVTERLVLNEVSQFIDKVTDKGLITEYDINDLYLGVNSHGGNYDVTIEHYQLLEEPLSDGSTKLLYVKQDDIEQIVDGRYNMENKDKDTDEDKDEDKDKDTSVSLNVKDVVKVHVKSVSMSPGRRLFWSVLRVDRGNFEFSLAGTVR